MLLPSESDLDEPRVPELRTVPNPHKVSRRNELKFVAGLSFVFLAGMATYGFYAGVFKEPNADVLCVGAFGDGGCADSISCKTSPVESQTFNSANVTFLLGFILAACKDLQSQCNLRNLEHNMTLSGMWENKAVSKPVIGKCAVNADALHVAIGLSCCLAVAAFTCVAWFVHVNREGVKELVVIQENRRASGLSPL
jgi:hypothetical protein